jgi:hypothetical protein
MATADRSIAGDSISAGRASPLRWGGASPAHPSLIRTPSRRGNAGIRWRSGRGRRLSRWMTTATRIHPSIGGGFSTTAARVPEVLEEHKQARRAAENCLQQQTSGPGIKICQKRGHLSRPFLIRADLPRSPQNFVRRLISIRNVCVPGGSTMRDQGHTAIKPRMSGKDSREKDDLECDGGSTPL